MWWKAGVFNALRCGGWPQDSRRQLWSHPRKGQDSQLSRETQGQRGPEGQRLEKKLGGDQLESDVASSPSLQVGEHAQRHCEDVASAEHAEDSAGAPLLREGLPSDTSQ